MVVFCAVKKIIVSAHNTHVVHCGSPSTNLIDLICWEQTCDWTSVETQHEWNKVHQKPIVHFLINFYTFFFFTNKMFVSVVFNHCCCYSVLDQLFNTSLTSLWFIVVNSREINRLLFTKMQFNFDSFVKQIQIKTNSLQDDSVSYGIVFNFFIFIILKQYFRCKQDSGIRTLF